MSGKRDYKKVCFVLMLALAAVWGGYNLGRSVLGPKQGHDYCAYYLASKMILHGERTAIYDTGPYYQRKAEEYGVDRIAVDGDKANIMRFSYPPVYALLTIPLTFLPYHASRYAFVLFSAIAMAVAVSLLFSNRDGEVRRDMVVVGLLGLFVFFPTYFNFYLGQINCALFLLCVLPLALIRKNRPWLAGLCLGLAIVVKLFPLILLPFFLIKRQYSVVVSAILSIVGMVGASMFVLGVDIYRVFATEIVPRELWLDTRTRSQGLPGFFYRLLTEGDQWVSLGNYPQLAHTLSLAAALVVIALVFVHTTRGSGPKSLRYDLEYGLYLMVPALVMQHSMDPIAIFLLLSYLFLFELLVYRSAEGHSMLFVTCVSFFIWSFVLTSGAEYEQLPKNLAANLLMSIKLCATLLLFTNVLWVLRSKRQAVALGQMETD